MIDRDKQHLKDLFVYEEKEQALYTLVVEAFSSTDISVKDLNKAIVSMKNLVIDKKVEKKSVSAV